MFVMVTSAPPDRPLYLGDLLEVIALPYGMGGQFTYHFKWFSASGYARLDRGSRGARAGGLLVYAEPSESGVRVYPLRYIRDIWLDVRNPSRLSDAAKRIESNELTPEESDLLVPVRFTVDNLFDFTQAATAAVKEWTARVGPSLHVHESKRLSGFFLQDVDGVDEPREEWTPSKDRWISLTDVLKNTVLNEHPLMHIDGIYSSTGQRVVPLCESGSVNKVRLHSATSYDLRIYSLWPASGTSDCRVKVTADSSAVAVSYPQFAVAGQRGEHTIFLQIQRINERIHGSLTVEAPADAAQRTDGERGSATAVGPQVSFAVICAPPAGKLILVLGAIALGILLANANEDLLINVVGIPAQTAKSLAPIVKAIGFILAGLSTFFGFRKVPG